MHLERLHHVQGLSKIFHLTLSAKLLTASKNLVYFISERYRTIGCDVEAANSLFIFFTFIINSECNKCIFVEFSLMARHGCIGMLYHSI